jgi:hypothetical protein
MASIPQSFSIIDGEERLDQVRELQDGAGPLLGVESSVRSHSRSSHLVASHTLPGRLEFARRPKRGLHDERSFGNASEAPDVARGLPAADLFVGVDEDYWGYRGPQAEIPQGPEGKYHLRQSALHVVDAWTFDNIVLDLDGHRG